MTGSYNNFFRVFDRTTKRDLTLEAARDIAKPKTLLKPRKVNTFIRFCFIHKDSCSYSKIYIHVRYRYALVVNVRKMRLALTVWTSIRRYFTLHGIHLKMWWLSLLRTISSYSKTNSSTSVCKYVENLNISNGILGCLLPPSKFCKKIS